MDWSKGNFARNGALVGYWMASQEAMGIGMRSCVSAAADLSRVGGMNIMNVVMTRADSVSAWMPPQAALCWVIPPCERATASVPSSGRAASLGIRFEGLGLNPEASNTKH